MSTSEATYGKLSFNGVLVGFTVEQPWKNNEKGKSCIPANSDINKYILFPHDSPKHPNSVAFECPELDVYSESSRVPNGVPQDLVRTDCLIHSANFASELEGCVAIGTDYLYNTSLKPIGVKNSKEALSVLQRYWGNRKGLEALISWSK